MTPGELSIVAGFWRGLKRAISSAKVQAAIGGLTTAWFTLRSEAATLPPMERCVVLVAFQGAVLVVLRELIAAWAAEDIAGRTKPPPPAPPLVQVAAADVVNERQSAAPTNATAAETQAITPAAVAPPGAQWRNPTKRDEP